VGERVCLGHGQTVANRVRGRVGTTYYNRRHRRVGHLFQGRFKAQLIEDEGYYREISRYIHLNPVRAGLTKRPQDWRWGSYPGYRVREIADALGYSTHGGVVVAIRRIENPPRRTQATLRKMEKAIAEANANN
jgi:hypothetical protein